MTTDELKDTAYRIRQDILKSLSSAGSGHLGASLGLADVFTVLYFDEMKLDAANPKNANRDRLVVSIGHVAPVVYATLAHRGFFPKEELLSLRKMGSRLQGHVSVQVPGVEVSTGSLGQGLSVAVGMAIAAKMDNCTWRVFSVHGDGELQEGQNWEAAMTASAYHLDNLVAIVDRNKVQIDGQTETVMPLEPLRKKWEAFGWRVLECNGNEVADLQRVFEEARKPAGKPVVILANTLMGKGVKTIEDDYHWHGKVPNAEELELFLKELAG